MTIISRFRQSQRDPEELDNSDQPNDRLDLLRYLADVQSRIKDDITSDFTLAKLSDQDKQGITEMFINAKLAKTIIQKLEEDYKRTMWEWDKDQHKWKRHIITENEKEKFKQYAERIYDSYMNRVYMVAILNRNKEKNVLLQLLGGSPEGQEEGQGESEQKKGVIQRLTDALRKKGKEKHEEEETD